MFEVPAKGGESLCVSPRRVQLKRKEYIPLAADEGVTQLAKLSNDQFLVKLKPDVSVDY